MDNATHSVEVTRAQPHPHHGGIVERWTEQDKEIALAIYAETSSAATASRETGIPKSTILGWLSEEGVDADLDRLRLAVRHSVAHKYVIATQLAMDVVIDTLRNGNEVIDKRGNVRRIKMSGKDAAFIASICTDKHALITGTMQRQQGAGGQLNDIAQRLLTAMQEAMDASKPPTPALDSDGPVLG